MGTIIMAVIVIVIVLKVVDSLGKAAPYVIIYGLIYGLHFYVWDWICWGLAIFFTIGFIAMEFSKHWNNDKYDA